jgi:hypothetical protein
MDISIQNKIEENKSGNDSNQPNQKSKVKKPEKPKLDDDAQGRTRSKTTTVMPNFEKKPQAKKEIKPVQTIGSDRFNSLLSMFDKKKPDNQEIGEVSSTPKMGKLDTGKFNTFSNKNVNESNTNKSAFVDPVIQARKERQAEVEKEEHVEEEHDSDNLHISEEEGEDQ